MSRRQRRGTRECLKDWGFQSNPFNEKTSPMDVWAGSTENRDYLEYVLEDAYDESNVIVYLLKGDYGSGKSYHMRYLYDYVIDEMAGLGIYFNFPSKVKDKGFQDILTEFITAIGAERIREVGHYLMEKNEIAPKGLNVRERLLGVLEKLGIERDLRFALCNIIQDKFFSETWGWLKGTATHHQTRKLQLLTTPKDEPSALRLISGLLAFLASKYKTIAIFIDELENLAGGTKAAQSVREGLRTLYDILLQKSHDSGVAIFFAATITTWILISETLKGALRDRVDEEIHLKPLTQEEAIHFVRDLFKLSRKDEEDMVGPPFENKSAFEHFVELARIKGKSTDSRKIGTVGTPRRIIKEGKTLFKRSCSKGIDIITKENVDSILGREGA